MKKNLDASWDTILSDIKEKLNDAEFYKWIKDLKILTFESNIITLKADNKFIKSWVEDKYLTKLKSALKEFYHLECDIKIVLSVIKTIHLIHLLLVNLTSLLFLFVKVLLKALIS